MTAASVAAGLAPPVYADAHCVVLDKPAGLLAVPGRGADKQDCLATRARAQWPDALVVHRLDMATSGLWLAARGVDAQRFYSRAFAAREVHKRYVAVVDGLMDGGDAQWQEIALPLGADWPNRPRQQVDPVHGKPSLTRWRVLAREHATRTTRVELAPVTGRSHQLRVHLQAIGHPILGDTLYAPSKVQARADRLLLHACGLRLGHMDGVLREHVSEPPF